MYYTQTIHNLSTIILNTYKQIYYTHKVIGINKADTLREFRFMLNNLNLKKERYIIENNIIAEIEEMNLIVKEMYFMIFEIFAKYDKYINYDLNEIELYFDDLQYRMSEEEINCHKARINYITSKAA